MGSKALSKKTKTLSTKDAPWSIRGVPPEAREAAKIAARRSGMSLGDWVGRALQEQAKESLQGHLPPAPRQEELLAQILEQMQAMNARVSAVEQRRSWLGRLLGK